MASYNPTLKYATNAYFTNSCPTGKRCYPSKSVAKQAAKNMRKAIGTDKMTAYECNKCSEIHLAHPKRSN